MEFIEFIQDLPPQGDKHITAFIEWAREQKYFPSSSDPAVLAKYLYDKLDWDLTTAYQKLFIVYEMEPDNTIPARYKGHFELLKGLNIIVDLKNKAGHNPEMKRSFKLKATRPLEYICMYHIEVPTEKDGDAYVFVAVDAYSEFAFMTGVEKDASDDTVLKHIELLMQHKDFVAKVEQPFTLVLHKYEDLRTMVSARISHLGGSMLVDNAYVTKVVTPVMKNMFKHLAGGMDV